MGHCDNPDLEYVRDDADGCCAIYVCRTCGARVREELPE